MVGDKGYFNASQIAACERDGITVYVPEPDKGGRQRQEGRFVQGDFTYEQETDTYRCPAGQVLHKSGEPYQQSGSLIQRYACSETLCRDCPMREDCITAKSARREVCRVYLGGMVYSSVEIDRGMGKQATVAKPPYWQM